MGLAAVSFARGFWPVLAVASGVLLRALWTARRTTLALKTYIAEVGTNSVTVRCDGLDMAPVTLRRDEVTGVKVFVKAGLRIQTADPSRDLWVPAHVGSYADVKARLSEWAPVTYTSLWKGIPEPPGALGLTAFCSLALLLPLPFATGIALGLASVAIRGVVKRDPRSRRHALSLLPAAIVLVRWML